MRLTTVTVSASAGGNSHSGIYVPDIYISPFAISIGAVIATTAKYTIQHTFQNPLDTSAGGLTWFSHETMVASSANNDGNYAFPVAGIRVELSASNEGGVSTTFIQAGIVS